MLQTEGKNNVDFNEIAQTAFPGHAKLYPLIAQYLNTVSTGIFKKLGLPPDAVWHSYM